MASPNPIALVQPIEGGVGGFFVRYRATVGIAAISANRRLPFVME